MIFCAENNIAVFSHDFHNQFFTTQIAQFIPVLNRKHQNTFQSGLPDRQDFAAADMFSEKHAEIRCSHWAWLVLLRQVSQRKRGAGRQQQPVLFFIIFYRNQKFVRFRLCDFCNMSAGQCLIQFFSYVRDGDSVKCHSLYSFIIVQKHYNIISITCNPEGEIFL